MNRHFFITGTTARVALVVLAVGATAGISGRWLAEVDTTKVTPFDHPILAPCSKYEDRYTALGFSDNYVQEWPAMYHKQVNDVIEDHLQMPKLTCDADDYESFLKPGKELEKLATKLPTWSDPSVRLTRYDLGRVLLEYLRVYECALNEFASISYLESSNEISKMEDLGIRDPLADPDMAEEFLNLFMPDMGKEEVQRLGVIEIEKKTARETLARTLGVVSGMDRLRPLEMELQCMQQVSVDIRNSVALGAEIGACLPRVWNAKDILRDLKP